MYIVKNIISNEFLTIRVGKVLKKVLNKFKKGSFGMSLKIQIEVVATKSVRRK